MTKRKRKPESPTGLNKIMTPAEEGRFVRYLISISGDPGGMTDLIIFDLMLQTGLRVSELCNLRVKDTPEYMGGDVIRVYRGKGSKTRDIPISRRLTRNLAKYRKEYRPETLPDHVRPSDRRKRLFYSKHKKPFKRPAIAHKIKVLGKLAGIPKRLTPHMCRHTFGTRSLLDSRVSLPELQVLMGHSKISTTQKYLHVVELLNPRTGNALDRGEWCI